MGPSDGTMVNKNPMNTIVLGTINQFVKLELCAPTERYMYIVCISMEVSMNGGTPKWFIQYLAEGAC